MFKKYGDDVFEDYTIDDDAFTLLHEDATKEVYDRLGKTAFLYKEIVVATHKPQAVLPLDNPETHPGFNPFIKNIKTVVEAVIAMDAISSYTLAYCSLLAHDAKWTEVSDCLQVHKIILEDLLTQSRETLSLLIAKEQFQQHKAMIRNLSQLKTTKDMEVSVPILKEMPEDRDLIRQTSLVAFVEIYYASQKNQAWSLMKEFISGNYYPNKPEFFADFIIQCRLSFFSADRDYAVKDILAIDAILKKNTGPISNEDQSALLKILKQKPRPMEWLWKRLGGQNLCRLLHPQ